MSHVVPHITRQRPVIDMATTQNAPTRGGAQLRPARADDLPAVERLLEASHLPLDGVCEALPTFIVAEAGTDIVGIAGLEICCDNALLRSVAVDDAWRSKGLGRALVTRTIAEAEARGIDALYLLTTTADRYFPTFGFRPIERDAVPEDIRATAEFREACPASATVMCRECAADG
jgi:N-acetylglutamate synthase-like GNAT family acetyltransferase